MKNEKEEVRSLNKELPALFAEELEQRLETDPLGISGLLDQYDNLADNDCIVYVGNDCPELKSCGCFGGYKD